MQDDKPKVPTQTLTMKAGLATAPSPLVVHPALGDLAPWDLDSRLTVMGRRQRRVDGPDKVTGRARYTQDVRLPGMLYGRMLGAAVPAGEIVSIDLSAAEALPGVRAVWKTDSKTIRFAGQDIAAVAAVSSDVAEDAIRLIKVTTREKP